MAQVGGESGTSSKASHGMVHVLGKALLLAALAGAAVVVSVVASVAGLTLVLVVAAIGALIAINFRRHTQRIPTPYQPRKVMLITGLVVVGFFLAFSIVGAVWPR